MKLSVIVPCYNEENNVVPFYNAVMKELKNIDLEILFINDGSRDQTFNKLKSLFLKDNEHVRIVDFSRNFGKEAALLAGLKESKGDFVSIIDADLQQNPKYIIDMLKILENNPDYDCVAAYQNVRKEGKILTFFKDCFYKLINRMTEIEIVRSASDFRTLKRCMVDAILSLPEQCRFSKGIFSWVGFNTYYMPYTVEERASGESKWSFWKLFRYAIDGIVAFSTTPLVISSIIGIILCFVSFIFIAIIVIKTLCFGDPVAGFPTLATIILLFSGLQLFFIGVLGQYLAKTYTESKHRPVYIVKNILEKESFKDE
ncbi:glycosyltransferase family 2 protein [Allocoprobacillus halotolerans]|uniref:Glycosyltransferase family 2 protein n=1 Tax=Allocoprobacillus halotolerans TaxID=2944914 RepID=A0ABY5HZ09_9FIRM|nr:glycosyltransferase family 2 protein [Allocoprobacillus halotolerans]UTY38333.1 glycosyltransferase family 2 protein [Allocoprobacillus halotolerans]